MGSVREFAGLPGRSTSKQILRTRPGQASRWRTEITRQSGDRGCRCSSRKRLASLLPTRSELLPLRWSTYRRHVSWPWPVTTPPMAVSDRTKSAGRRFLRASVSARFRFEGEVCPIRVRGGYHLGNGSGAGRDLSSRPTGEQNQRGETVRHAPADRPGRRAWPNQPGWGILRINLGGGSSEVDSDAPVARGAERCRCLFLVESSRAWCT